MAHSISPSRSLTESTDGRRQYVDILDCYLKQNLAAHGGYLDEVHFIMNTEDQDDRMWLDTLISTSEHYKKIDHDITDNFLDLWKYAMERDTMYIKIDDDLVSGDSIGGITRNIPLNIICRSTFTITLSLASSTVFSTILTPLQ
jgi:hypothetical protein